jgi:hypothetical protein
MAAHPRIHHHPTTGRAITGRRRTHQNQPTHLLRGHQQRPFPKPAISRMSVHPNRLRPIRQIHNINSTHLPTLKYTQHATVRNPSAIETGAGDTLSSPGLLVAARICFLLLTVMGLWLTYVGWGSAFWVKRNDLPVDESSRPAA